ncbi:MAG: ABC transporter permease [Ilumatobacteraceae bacterium]
MRTVTVRPRAVRRAARWPASVVVALVVLVVVAVSALAGSAIAPYRAGETDLAKSVTTPSAENLLGTDELGRDILSRLLVGARSAVTGPLVIALGTLAIATALALLAAYRRGWIDQVISRVIDTIYSLPALLVAIVVVGVVGGGYVTAIVVLTVMNIPQNYRIVRGAAIEQRAMPYVEAAQSLGHSTSRILLRHLLPNVMPFVVAAFFLRFTFAIVELSSLSFVGLGVPPGASDWGRMLSENRHFLESNPWAAIAPGLALVFTAASANVVGNELFERISSRGRAR